jgi:hypothetical protein
MARARNPVGGPNRTRNDNLEERRAASAIVGDGALDALRKRAEKWGLILHERPARSEGASGRKGGDEKRGRGR